MANGLCEALISAGITLGGVCVEAPQGDIVLPQEDAGVYDHVAPAPKPEPVAKPTAADFPAAVIEVERVVEKVVYKDRPAPKPAPQPMPEPAPPPMPKPAPNLEALELALKYNMALRRAQFTPLEERPLIGSGSVVHFASTEQMPPRSVSPEQGFDLPSLNAKGLQAKDQNTRAEISSPYEGVLSAYLQGLNVKDQSYSSPGVEAGPNIDNRYIMRTDRVIQARLETGLNSQSKTGVAVFEVSRDTYSYHGWGQPLIPVGSRLVCTYEGPEAYGETRVYFKCNRLLLAEGAREVLVNATVGDIQGHEGLSGEVDNRNWEKYGDAAIMTAASAAIKYAGTKSAQQTVGGSQSAEGQALDSAATEIGEKIGQITGSILENTINLKPIVTIAQGTLVLIRPSEDWYLPPVELSSNVRK